QAVEVYELVPVGSWGNVGDAGFLQIGPEDVRSVEDPGAGPDRQRGGPAGEGFSQGGDSRHRQGLQGALTVLAGLLAQKDNGRGVVQAEAGWRQAGQLADAESRCQGAQVERVAVLARQPPELPFAGAGRVQQAE